VVRIDERPIAVPGIGVEEDFVPRTEKNAVPLVFQYENFREQDTEE
jgi:hypothetical protein